MLTPRLTITSQADTASIVAGGIVNYTVTVANTGQTPYTGATYTDPIGGAIYGGDAWASSGSDVARRRRELIWTGDLAEGATATVTYSVRIAPSAGDSTLATTITSPTRGSNCAAGLGRPALLDDHRRDRPRASPVADLTRSFTPDRPTRHHPAAATAS